MRIRIAILLVVIGIVIGVHHSWNNSTVQDGYSGGTWEESYSGGTFEEPAPAPASEH